MRNINQQLVQITPGRTLEAIKGVCKSMSYKERLPLCSKGVIAVYLLDVTVVADYAVIHLVHKSKIQYYMLDIGNWILLTISGNMVMFSSATLHWALPCVQ